MKKALATVMAMATLGCAMMGAACGGPEVIDKVDETKTTLRIANYNGGVGEKWLDNLADRFEDKVKDEVFEEGKKGVQVIIDHQKNYSGKELGNSLKADTNNHLYFTQALDYNMMASQGLLADITDLVKDTTGEDGKKIVDKLNANKKSYLEKDGKYYAIPHYELYNGLQYDAGVFKEKKLYFSDVIRSDGTRGFVANDTAKKSPGPDGKYNTYDDGLPSSYEEFYTLLKQMKSNGVIPFVWTGKSTHYTNMLVSTLFANYIGKDGFDVLFNYEEKEIEIVTNYAGGVVQTEMQKLNKDTAYKVKGSAAMYYALEFCQKVFSKGENYSEGGYTCTGANFSHIQAQQKLWFSGLDGEESKVAMLIDGNYSYNEAADAGTIEQAKTNFSAAFDQKDIRYMPMPVQYEGTVTEGKGKAPVLVDCYQSYAFINANTSGASMDAAKAFLSYAYTDEQMQKFTLETNGIMKGVSYDLSAIEESDELCSNGKYMLQMRKAAEQAGTLIYPFTGRSEFLKNAAKFNLSTGGDFWAADSQTIMFNAFNSGTMTAAQYFEQVQLTASEWQAIIA
ncbi:MAG: hypothetical protein E7357_02860 [Clostridiales bacterium]|nr:hypothetical protein [Clostridiales bacterium]